MSLVNPILFVLGVAFVALPIVLHFLRRRRPPVLWGAMRFLQEAYRRRRRRMTLEQLVLLLCRCALVLLVALLIGRPIFGGASEATGPREVYLVVDNSIASGRAVDDGLALDQFKERASALLDELDASAGDRAALITLAGPAEGVVFPASGDLSAVRRVLVGIEPADSAADLPGAFALVGETDADADPAGRSMVVISELRGGSVDTGVSLPPVPASFDRVVIAEPSQAQAGNIAIAGVRSLRSVVLGAGRVGGQSEVTLERSGVPGLPAASVSVELWASGAGRLAEGVISFDAGQTRATGLIWFELPESDADRAVVVEARLATGTAGDTVAADNVRRKPIDRRRSIEVGLVARRTAPNAQGGAALERFDAADWVRLALAPQPGAREINVIDVRPAGVDAARLSSLDAAVVLSPDALDARAWAALRSFADAGGLVVVTPPSGDDVQLWTDAFVQTFDLGWSLAREISVAPNDAVAPDLIESASGLLGMLAGEFDALASGVGVARMVAVDVTSAGAAVEVETAGGVPLVLSAPVGGDADPGRGLVVFIASALVPAWTDLPTRPLMVPMMQELIRQGVGRAGGDALAIAGRVDAPEGSRVVDELGAPVSLPVRTAGVYAMDGDGQRVVAVNPDTRGARLDAIGRPAIEAWLKTSVGDDRLAWLDASGGVERAGGVGEPVAAGTLVLWIAALALALAVIETLLARVASRGAVAADLAGGAAA